MNSDTKKILTWVGLGCATLGCLLSVIFSIVTCAKGEWTIDTSAKSMSQGIKVKMSLAFIGTIIGIVLAIVGIVLTIVALEKEGMMFKVAIISIAVATFAVLYGTISTVTVCSYGFIIPCHNKYIIRNTHIRVKYTGKKSIITFIVWMNTLFNHKERS